MTAPFAAVLAIALLEKSGRCCWEVMVSVIKISGLNYGRPRQVMAMRDDHAEAIQ